MDRCQIGKASSKCWMQTAVVPSNGTNYGKDKHSSPGSHDVRIVRIFKRSLILVSELVSELDQLKISGSRCFVVLSCLPRMALSSLCSVGRTCLILGSPPDGRDPKVGSAQHFPYRLYLHYPSLPSRCGEHNQATATNLLGRSV